MDAVTIELALPPDAALRLGRLPALAGRRIGRARPTPVEIVWYAPPAPDLTLSREGGAWRLARPRARYGLPDGETPVAEATSPEALGHGVDPDPHPHAAFSGRRRRITLAPAAGGATLALTVLEGALRDISRARPPVCRVAIAGGAGDAAALARALVTGAGATLASRSLAAEALAPDAAGSPPALPELRPEMPLDAVLAALFGTLGATLLHWAPLAALGEGPHPVHQMRVTIRRLRSAMVLFRDAIGGALERERELLRELAATLGGARDWDVFLGETASGIAGALPAGESLDRLLADAGAAREAAYRSLRTSLASEPVRSLLADLALLPLTRPWRTEAADADADGAGEGVGEAAGDPEAVGAGVHAATRRPAPLDVTLAVVAPPLVARRYRRLVRGRGALCDLPPEALHDTRKAAKKLRYALEFLQPAFPRGECRRFVKRLGRAQDALGAINDTETGAALMARLRQGGRHGHASGIVIGWLAAHGAMRRETLAADWAEIRDQDRFWRA